MKPSLAIQIGLVLVVLGLASGQPLVIIPGMLFAILGFISWLWGGYLLNNVTCNLELSRRRARPGETVAAYLEIINRQPFPLPWLRCVINWPEDRGLARLRAGELVQDRLEHMLTLRWFERVTRKLEIHCLRRGEYILGPVALKAADLFGFTEGQKTVPREVDLVVYPRILPLCTPPPAFISPFGNKAAPSWLYEDPVYFRGSRAYVPTDPFTRIEWKTTARTGQMHTRIFDASYATEVILAVNTSTGEHIWRLDRELLERTLVVAASILQCCHTKKFRFGLYLNGFVRGTKTPAAVRIGTGADHFRHCLEVMGRILPARFVKFERVLATAGSKAAACAHLLVISGTTDQGMLAELHYLKKQGVKTAIVFSGKDAPQTGRLSLPAFTIKEEGNWDELATITLNPYSGG